MREITAMANIYIALAIAQLPYGAMVARTRSRRAGREAAATLQASGEAPADPPPRGAKPDRTRRTALMPLNVNR